MNAALKTTNETAYPSTGTTNPGVYMPYTNTSASLSDSAVHDRRRHLRRRQR